MDRLGQGSELLEEMGADCEEKGRAEVAVRLFDLAEVAFHSTAPSPAHQPVPLVLQKHGRVVRLLNGLLAGVASVAPLPESPAARIVGLATEIGARYRREGSAAPAADLATFHLLLDIRTFFALHRVSPARLHRLIRSSTLSASRRASMGRPWT